MATPQLTDERLAWLAVRDEVQELCKPAAVVRILRVIIRRRAVDRGIQNEITDDKMRVYAIAVDELSRRLTREDRLVLRSTGKVPEWFMPTVILEARNIKLG